MELALNVTSSVFRETQRRTTIAHLMECPRLRDHILSLARCGEAGILKLLDRHKMAMTAVQTTLIIQINMSFL